MSRQSLHLIWLPQHEALQQALIDAEQKVLLRELPLIILPKVFEEVLAHVL